MFDNIHVKNDQARRGEIMDLVLVFYTSRIHFASRTYFFWFLSLLCVVFVCSEVYFSYLFLKNLFFI